MSCQQNTGLHEVKIEDINRAKAEFVQAALNAINAGFDGVEIQNDNINYSN